MQLAPSSFLPRRARARRAHWLRLCAALGLAVGVSGISGVAAAQAIPGFVPADPTAPAPAAAAPARREAPAPIMTVAAADASLRLALGGKLRASGGVATFFVAEQRQGKTDLDGDQQTNDSVLHLFNGSAAMTVNTRLPAVGAPDGPLNQVVLGQNTAVFLLSEKVRGMDLNQDRDMDDSVVQVVNLTSGEIMNLGLAGSAVPERGASGVAASGNRVAFGVSEADQNKTDLNGDGDTGDLVLHEFDVTTKRVTNRRMAISSVALAGDVMAFAVPEADQMRTDLNGDGDLGDSVLHVLKDGITTNTTRAVGEFSLQGSLIVFLVNEKQQGRTDLDGNGRVGDSVLHVFSAETHRTTNVAFSPVGEVQIAGELVAFAASESQSRKGGQDLNGDMDKSDNVVQLFDAKQAMTTNTGLAMATGAEPFELSDALVAIRVSEKASGNQDLNGDGDTSDDVLHVFERGRRAASNVGLALAAKDAFEASGRVVTFRVSEKGDGNLDLNGDTDKTDDVLHVFTGGRPRNLGLVADLVRLDGNLAVFGVDEAKQGGKDMNGDGDARDRVIHVLEASSGRVTSLLASRSAPELRGNAVAFLASEADQGGKDLDGDGDSTDVVLHVFDARSRTIANMGRATDAFAMDSGVIAFSVPESKQGRDLNGDGDMSDDVVHAVRLNDGPR